MILSEICEIKKGKSFHRFSKEKTEDLSVPIMGIGGVVGYTYNSTIDDAVICIGVSGTIGRAQIRRPPCAISSTQMYLIPDITKVDFLYIYAFLSELDYTPYTIKSTRQGMDIDAFYRLQIPDISLAKQKAIGVKYFMMEAQAELTERHIEGLKRFKQVMMNMMFC